MIEGEWEKLLMKLHAAVLSANVLVSLVAFFSDTIYRSIYQKSVIADSPFTSAGIVARGVHWLMVSDLDTAGRERRQLQQLLNDPPLTLYAPGADDLVDKSTADTLTRTFSLTAGSALPEGTHILTLM